MRQVALVVALALLASAPGVGAHHGYADFHDPAERTQAIEGVLDALEYANPHVILTVRAEDGTLYRAVWQAAAWVEQVTGATETTFQTGDRVLVVGAPALDPRDRTLTRLREVRLPAHGWHWVSQQPFAPPR